MAVSIGRHWRYARRRKVVVHDDRITCGDWTIPFASVVEATSQGVEGAYWDGRALCIRCLDGAVYQIGLTDRCRCFDQLPFPVRTIPGRLYEGVMSQRSWKLAVYIPVFLVLVLVAPRVIVEHTGSRLLGLLPLALWIAWEVVAGLQARRRLQRWTADRPDQEPGPSS